MLMERKVVPVTGFKVIDDEAGIVEAFVSVTGAIDSVKDRIIPGAYEKTLAARTPKGVWSHNWDQPVSKTVSAEEVFPGDDRLPQKTRTGEEWPATAGALLVRTQFNVGDGDNPGTQRARDAFSDVKFYGDEQEWSIGYNVPPGASKVDAKTGVRELSYIDLYEYSPVLFGAMSLTQTAGVKDAQEAFKAAVEAGDMQEGMVVATEAKDGQEAVTEDAPDVPAVAAPFDEVTPDTPITTPADPIHQVVQGHTGDSAGVEVEPRPAAAAVPVVEDPKSAEFTVALTPEAEGAVKAVQEWAMAEAVKDGADVGSVAAAALEKVKAITDDRSSYTVQAVDVEDGKAMVTLTGSFEERQEAVRKQLRSALSDFDLDGTDEYGYPNWYVTTEATFNNKVVAVAYDMTDGSTRYFEAGYTFDGQQATLKSAREVRVEANVAAKGAERGVNMVLSLSLFRKAAGQDVPTPHPTDTVGPVNGGQATPGDEKALEGEDTVVVLTDYDLALLDRLKLDA